MNAKKVLLLTIICVTLAAAIAGASFAGFNVLIVSPYGYPYAPYPGYYYGPPSVGYVYPPYPYYYPYYAPPYPFYGFGFSFGGHRDREDFDRGRHDRDMHGGRMGPRR